MKHVRKPLTPTQTSKASDVPASESQDKVEGEVIKEEEKVKVKETPARERQGEGRDVRDWKRNGMLSPASSCILVMVLTVTICRRPVVGLVGL